MAGDGEDVCSNVHDQARQTIHEKNIGGGGGMLKTNKNKMMSFLDSPREELVKVDLGAGSEKLTYPLFSPKNLK